MKAVIITPTYNERDNIGTLIDVLETQIFPGIPKSFDMGILVVDDSSPDGTAEVVQEYQKKYKNLHLVLNKQKAGLGGAYMKGMTYAADELKVDVMFEMDADLQHDPKLIPAFLDKIEKGCDLVLGSRYIKGGSIPSDWGWNRKFLSVVGNLIIRIVLGHFAVHDCTTGYRAIRTEVFQSLRNEMEKKEFSGYTWQIGFLHKTIRKGFKVSEVPLKFIDRRFGKSKLGVEYIKNNLLYIFSIRLKELEQVGKFAVVGAIGFIINYTALQVFHLAFGISPDNAAALGAELAIVSNFVLNNLWTFKAQRATGFKEVIQKFLQFNVASLGAVAIQKIVVWLGIQFTGEALYQLYFIIAVAIGMVVNYLMYSRLIWKKQA